MYRRIKLDKIIVESPSRHSITKLSQQNFSLPGLVDAIVVEGPTDEDEYYLIRGYNRYTLLRRSQVQFAICQVECLTCKVKRNSKTLLVNGSIQPAFDELADDTTCSKQITLMKNGRKKTSPSIVLPENLLQRATQAGVKPHGIAKLIKISNISAEVLDSLLTLFYEHQLPITKIPLIKRLVKMQGFQFLSTDKQMQCIKTVLACKNKNNAILKSFFDQATVDDVVIQTTELLNLLQYVKDNYSQELIQSQQECLNLLLANTEKNQFCRCHTMRQDYLTKQYKFRI